MEKNECRAIYLCRKRLISRHLRAKIVAVDEAVSRHNNGPACLAPSNFTLSISVPVCVHDPQPSTLPCISLHRPMGGTRDYTVQSTKGKELTDWQKFRLKMDEKYKCA